MVGFVIVALLLGTFLVGSIPTGYLVGRLRGIDLRTRGSGNIGATNAFRALGTTLGFVVLLLDIGRGAAVTAYAPELVIGALEPHLPAAIAASPELRAIVAVFLGAAVVAGNVWSVFLSGKGGKGVATAGGALLGISPVVTCVAAFTFLVTFVNFRYVSLGSIVGALTALVAAVALDKSVVTVILVSCLAALIVFRHRGNIARIRNGTEPRVHFPWESKKETPS